MVERDLTAAVPKAEWIQFGNRVVTHGRRICHARSPKCADCFLADICPSAFVAAIPAAPVAAAAPAGDPAATA